MTTKTPADDERDAASEGNAPASKRRVLSRDDVPALREAMGADGEGGDAPASKRRFLTADEILALPDDPDAASGDPPAEFVEIDERRFAKQADGSTTLAAAMGAAPGIVRAAFADMSKRENDLAKTLAGQAIAGPGFQAALAAIGIQSTAASLAGLDKSAAIKASAAITGMLDAQLAATRNVRQLAETFAGIEASASAIKMLGTQNALQNLSADALAKSMLGFDKIADLQAAIKPAWLDAAAFGLADSLAEWSRARQEKTQRNRARARPQITTEHVAAALPYLDWDAFIAKQRDDDDSEAQAQLLDDLAAALKADTPAADGVREAIARELLLFAWAIVAEDMEFDGDRSHELEWTNAETDEVVTRPATPEDVTFYLDKALREADSEYWTFVSDRYVDFDILEGVWDAYQKAALPAAPNYAPAFRDGIGRIPTHAVAYGAARAQIEPWIAGDDGNPEFIHSWGKGSKGGVARYRIGAAPSVDAAWEVANRLGPRHADVFDCINAMWIANRDKAANGLRLTASEVLDILGYTKQTAGGHKSEYVEMIAGIVRDLKQQTVESRFEHYAAGKRKPETVVIESRLVVESTNFSRLTLEGGRREFAWLIRPGDWATQLHELQPQYGVALLAVLRLNPQSDYIAKQIGRYLLHNWRERFANDEFARPYRIADLLEKAAVQIDKANPKRFRTRVEAAFETLRGEGVIQSWTYGANVPPPKGRWLAGWLAGGVAIIPHPAVIERKQAFPSRRRGGAKTFDKGKAARKPEETNGSGRGLLPPSVENPTPLG
jgi:hypothetical protein